jgi:NADPH:quinone reductase-like Zn-dependent oxidoreductase
MSVQASPPDAIPETMRAVRLHPPGGLQNLKIEDIAVPRAGRGDLLIRVQAAGLTRDELDWPVDRLPATPSYEPSGVVADVGEDVDDLKPGIAVFARAPFDRDGAAAEYTVVPASDVAPKPASLSHAEAAALPLAGLSAWQGLFVHGRLAAGERVLIHGATGGVGHLATQLAHWRGAHVIGTVTGNRVEAARRFGADEVIDRSIASFEDVVEPVDLVFDTVGGDVLARSTSVLRGGGRLVTVAEEPPSGSGGIYFIVEPNREQLVELARLADEQAIHPAVDSTFPLDDAAKAFERLMSRGKSGKVVLEVRS